MTALVINHGIIYEVAANIVATKKLKRI